MRPVRYAVVVSHGRYGSGDLIIAASVHADPATALRRARRMTREHQQGMRRYGGTSGGYRVVETLERRASAARWRGVDLDREPTVAA